MKHISTRRDPRFLVEITLDEIKTLVTYSDAHYDARCRSLNQVGGLIYGFQNRLILGETAVTIVELTWQDVDLLCKVLEAEPAPAPLYHALRGLLVSQ